MNESSLPQVSEPLSSKSLSSEPSSSEPSSFEPPSSELSSSEPSSSELSSSEPSSSEFLNSEFLSAEPSGESSSEPMSAEPLRDLPSSSHDIPMAVREAPSLAPQATVKSSRLLLGLGSMSAIALLAVGSFVAMRSQSANSTVGTVASPTAQSSPGAASSQVSSEVATASPTQTTMNHFPYSEAPQGELTPITPNGDILMRKAAAAKFVEMQDAARAAGISLEPISGFRSQEDQNHLFFDVKAQRGQDTATRLEVSAPPGYSEHHTGYAVDIGDGDRPELNLQTEFETAQAFQWLKENAAFYSFELSFPKNNTQGVSYEPWHWRFVGDRNSLETFYRAKALTPSKAAK
ncbi:MAG TPA: M15 family metallopeptidase [Coleofasciculaceae cyanobacterium]